MSISVRVKIINYYVVLLMQSILLIQLLNQLLRYVIDAIIHSISVVSENRNIVCFEIVSGILITLYIAVC